jgi:hypothetical protein
MKLSRSIFTGPDFNTPANSLSSKFRLILKNWFLDVCGRIRGDD